MRNVLQAVFAMLLIEVYMAPPDSFAETRSRPDSRHVLCTAQRPLTAYRFTDLRVQKPAAGIVFGIDIYRVRTVIFSTILRQLRKNTAQPDNATNHESAGAEQPLCAPMGIDDQPALDGSTRHTNPALTGS